MSLKAEVLRTFESNGAIAELNLERLRSAQDFELLAIELRKFYKRFWDIDGGEDWQSTCDNSAEYYDEFFDDCTYLKPHEFFRPNFVFNEENKLVKAKNEPEFLQTEPTKAELQAEGITYEQYYNV